MAEDVDHRLRKTRHPIDGNIATDLQHQLVLIGFLLQDDQVARLLIREDRYDHHNETVFEIFFFQQGREDAQARDKLSREPNPLTLGHVTLI